MAERKGVGKVLGRAVAGPLNLSVLGGAVLGAVALASWPIAAIGGAAYAALVASDVSSVDFRRRVLFGKQPARKLPRPGSLRDLAAAGMVEKIAAARAEIDKVVRATPERLQRMIGGATASIEELLGHGAMLAVRVDEISRYLETVSVAEIEREVQELTTHAARTADPGARAGYEAAAAAGRERLKAVQDIVGARERTFAHLARIAATLAGVPAKLVRLRALDDQASDELTGDVGAELDRMNVDLRAFEETLEALVEVQA
jgi:F0F1-type ATP synthase membrane subunit b/b'